MPLPLDDAGMEVLEWLEDASFEWDMCVDLPANCIRYCFRTLADATAFKQRFANASERRAIAGRLDRLAFRSPRSSADAD
jgi:hypothetical protein